MSIATHRNAWFCFDTHTTPAAQRRNARTNAAIAAFPALLCVLLVTIQRVVDSELERPPFRCGCVGTECGIQYSTPIQALACAVPAPPRWPALVQVPPTEARALTRLHPRPCKASEKSCPATVLLTGQNRQLAQGTYRCTFHGNLVHIWLGAQIIDSSLFLLNFLAGLGNLLFPPVPPQYGLMPAASNSSDYLDLFSTVVPVSTLLS
jgi:hypothetical protein